MNKKALILCNSLKDILSLFNKDEELKKLTFADTWHHLSGLVDESILKDKHKISEILAFDYDFKGLIEFEANIATMKIKRSNETLNGKEEYEIQGTIKDLETVKNKLIELNAYHPNKYTIRFEPIYDKKA